MFLILFHFFFSYPNSWRKSMEHTSVPAGDDQGKKMRPSFSLSVSLAGIASLFKCICCFTSAMIWPLMGNSRPSKSTSSLKNKGNNTNFPNQKEQVMHAGRISFRRRTRDTARQRQHYREGSRIIKFHILRWEESQLMSLSQSASQGGKGWRGPRGANRRDLILPQRSLLGALSHLFFHPKLSAR